MGISLESQSTLASGVWYVRTNGNDANDCLSAATPCNTIKGAIGKADSGDTIYVASGTYTNNIDNEVVSVSKNITFTGGWDATFTTQNSFSVIDGENVRRGIAADGVVSFDRFVIKRGYHSTNDEEAGGIQNWRDLTLSNCTVRESYGFYYTGGIVNNGNLTANDCFIENNGGGIFNSGCGRLVLNNSSVRNNGSPSKVGGIYNLCGTVTLNNSTVSGNSCDMDGCGIYNQTDGAAELSSSTVAGNVGAYGGIGIFNAGSMILRNTIVAKNILRYGGDEPDCYGAINSAGYNLIGNVSSCSFAASEGDLLNVNPHGVQLGSNYALLSDSPAIDHGNPDGCQDHLGHVLATDQRGMPRPLDGNGDGTFTCDIGAYEHDPLHPARQILFASVFRDYCQDFFDDFSDPASGWPVGEDSYVRTEYLNGEYRVASKRGGYLYAFRSPTCSHENYIVETDVRWVGRPGSGYGLLFGITSDFSKYYLYYVNLDYDSFYLFLRTPSGFTQLNSGMIPGLHKDGTPNHFKVTRIGDRMWLVGNGFEYLSWTDGASMGLTGVGLASSSYTNQPNPDARFDNFRVTALPSSAGTAKPGFGNIELAQAGSEVATVNRLVLPVDLAQEVQR